MGKDRVGAAGSGGWRRWRRVVALVVAGTAWQAAEAQSTGARRVVSGQVVADSGRPIAGASLSLLDAAGGARARRATPMAAFASKALTPDATRCA